MLKSYPGGEAFVLRRPAEFGFPPIALFGGHSLRILPFALSLSKGERQNPTDVKFKFSRSWFDKLTTNG